MNQRILHEPVNVIFYYRDNYLLPGRTFSCHLDVRLGLGRSFDDVVDLVNLVIVQECGQTLD